MILRPLHSLFFVLASLLASTSANADEQQYTATINGEGEVLACWQGKRLIQPLDCLGLEVMAYPFVDEKNMTDAIPAKLGRVAERPSTILPSNSIVAQWRIYPQPLPIEAWHHIDKPSVEGKLPVFLANAVQPSANASLPLEIGKKPDTARALAALQSFVIATYTDTYFDLFTTEYIYPAPVLWYDVDGDGASEAITIVPHYNEATPECQYDLLVARFNADGSLSSPAVLAAQKQRSPCSLGNLNDIAGNGWELGLLAWPGARQDLALTVESGDGPGHAINVFVIDLGTIETTTNLLADYFAFTL